MPDLVDFLIQHLRLTYGFCLFPFGACAGSFINVVAFRLPRGLHLNTPPSTCARCGQSIRGFDNIPILSWLWLRGRCRDCKAPISIRYLIVETVVAGLWFAVGYKNAENDFGHYQNIGLMMTELLFVSSLLVVVIIDFEFQIVPDEISLGGLVAALIVAGLLPDLHLHNNPEIAGRFPASPVLASLISAFLGALLGGGMLLAMSLVGTLFFRDQIKKAQEDDPEIKSVIGLGDVKLMAFVGAILGWKAMLAGFAVGNCLGALIGAVDKFRSGSWPRSRLDAHKAARLAVFMFGWRWGYRWWSGRSFVPYGPALCTGAMVLVFFRGPILGYFAELFAPLAGAGG